MYRYTEFDKAFVRSRAAQFRDQVDRWQQGALSEDAFRPLRLQNGWYVQRHPPMLRVAVPYGELSSAQIRVLARIARDYDVPDPALYRAACDAQARLGTARLPTRNAHFTTRTNVQFNWIPLSKAADVMDLLATVDMHGIQTSGNCIRNISCDERAGVAPDEIADPRPFAEVMRQWTTLHPEFAFLPRKFKIAITGAAEDRAATDWHDVGLKLVRDAAGELGFRVSVGGGMGRTPMTATLLRAFLPWRHVMNYIEAVVRVYNRYGRRDNKYKARDAGLASANARLLTDMIACPGGDFCALANARSIPIADAIAERFDDLDELNDIGDIGLHISGCINSCGHHHSGHIGILGVDKDGDEWYQVTLGGSDGTAASGPAQPGKVIGPSFSADEIVDVVDAIVATYLRVRQTEARRRERFIDAYRRVGPEPFRAAANAARHFATSAA
ncbi:nitrite/sulfite reductase [Burkholderia oklahomensis]|uniref:nitrite/sulfite reductase n=1 Tax=Burkholderia oklahomensis TaxID=342113 RepID=UPI00265330D5|nr:nitrite/sulfite reductase [Burkholderia oklahomensis]MDN7676464.1 nitrite/sulfite reductase [Burkholderia oklahomensis]